MNTFIKPRWQIKENNVSSENLYFNRRDFIKKTSIYLGSSTIAYNCFGKFGTASQNNINNLEFIKNNKYNIISKITSENLSTKYNNFFEFGSTKNIWKEAQKLDTDNSTPLCFINR